MWLLLFIACFGFVENALWDKNVVCPKMCTCRLEHPTEIAIYRFIQSKNVEVQSEINVFENNDVFYEEDKESKPVIKSAMCMLLTGNDPVDILELLPEDIESLTLIQGIESGNKTFKFSYLDGFDSLVSLELLGSHLGSSKNASQFVCEIDKSIQNLKHLNLERVMLKNSKTQIQKFVNEVNDNAITFEYVQKHNPNSHPLTIVQKGVKDEILPYTKFLRKEKDSETPLFIGFKELLLLRLTNCELNSVHWQMFDGLTKLEYLILEKNNLRFIPDFAFYGTPNLKSLSLAHNNLLNIQITDLAGLLELEYLDLSHNNFSQLSELSLPPFPKLKLANFGNNPISIVYPNTFEVLNTTDSLILGSDHTSLELLPNSFIGLNLLKILTINHLAIHVLNRELFIGMPNLRSLVLTGNISEIQYDAFLEIYKLDTLILSNCNIRNLSMDSFIGLENLLYLDLSKNLLTTLPPGVFEPLNNLKELYLNNNKFKQLPRDVFLKIRPKLIRLNDNPWHCSCEMSGWKQIIVNKIKQKATIPCEMSYDKSACSSEFSFKYVYDNKVTPKCVTPEIYENWSVFHVMRGPLKCPDVKPYKIKKIKHKTVEQNVTSNPVIEVNVTLKEEIAKNEVVDEADIKFNELSPISDDKYVPENLAFRKLKNSNDKNLQSANMKKYKKIKKQKTK